jgi:hypothetical protein
MGGVRSEHMVKNKANSIMQTVFKRKLNKVAEKHVNKVIEYLERKRGGRMEDDSVNSNHHGYIETKIQELHCDIERKEELVSSERSNADFEEHFSVQRLVIISDSIEDNW